MAAIDPALPLLAERHELLRFPVEVEIHRPNDVTFSSDVIIVDEAHPSWTTLNRGTFDQIVDALDYQVAVRFGTISVYRAGSSSADG